MQFMLRMWSGAAAKWGRQGTTAQKQGGGAEKEGRAVAMAAAVSGGGWGRFVGGRGKGWILAGKVEWKDKI